MKTVIFSLGLTLRTIQRTQRRAAGKLFGNCFCGVQGRIEKWNIGTRGIFLGKMIYICKTEFLLRNGVIPFRKLGKPWSISEKNCSVEQKVSEINKSLTKHETSLDNTWSVLICGYLFAVTLHICNKQEANKSATRRLRDIRMFWKRKIAQL